MQHLYLIISVSGSNLLLSTFNKFICITSIKITYINIFVCNILSFKGTSILKWSQILVAIAVECIVSRLISHKTFSFKVAE